MLESFTIFAKYGSAEIHGADHDEIWAGPNPEIVSTEDLAALEILGWHPHEDYFHHWV